MKIVFGHDQIAAATLWRQLVGRGREIVLVNDQASLFELLSTTPNPSVILVNEKSTDFLSRLRSQFGERVYLIGVLREPVDQTFFDWYQAGADFVVAFDDELPSLIARFPYW